MRAFQLLLCCVLFAGCMRNASSLPTTVPNGPAWQAKYSNLPSATKPRFTNLYNFRGLADGGLPASVMVTINGQLYGTVQSGGAYGYGGVFEMSPSGTERIIYSFDAPFRRLFGLTTMDGKLYGLTRGAVFEVSLSGEARVFHRFHGSADAGNFAPGKSGLIAMNHKIYGMSSGGGSNSKYCHTGGLRGCGTVFELSKSGVERVLHRFNGRFDGMAPYGTLVAFDDKLYGTTIWGGISGGLSGEGVVFEMSMSGKERVLYRFKREPDADRPEGKLVVINGKLYGVGYGGKYDYGAIFVVGMSGKERVLKSFRHHNEIGRGVNSLTVLGGKIYGTTGTGGLGDGGTIFEMSPSGEASALHYFKRDSSPVGGLVVLGGRLYGATSNGGLPGCSERPIGNCGTLFEFSL